MMRDDWIRSVEQEGNINTKLDGTPAAHDPDGEPSCPACGTAAPLVDGCCSDCGLFLG
jgi:hypothetical protein